MQAVLHSDSFLVGVLNWFLESPHQPEDATLLVNTLAVCCAKPGTLASSTDVYWIGDSSGQRLGLGSIGRVVRSVLLESPNV